MSSSVPSRPPARPVILTAAHGYGNLRREVRRGELEQLRRGAYVPPRAADVDRWAQWDADLVSRCRAVAASLQGVFAFSHETAAALRDWQAPVRDVVHIVQRYRSGRRSAPDIVRHYRPDLTDTDIVLVRGLPVTAPARTLIDCTLLSSPPTALAIADSGLRAMARVKRFERERSIEDQEVVRSALLFDLEARGTVRHVRRAREVLRYADGLAEFAGESWLRWLVLARGLPEPELQIPVTTPAGTFYADMMWRGEAARGGRPLIAEYDGTDKYAAGGAGQVGEVVVAQTDREQHIRAATGADVLRFTKRDRRNPNRAARRLIDALPNVERSPRPALLARPRHSRPSSS